MLDHKNRRLAKHVPHADPTCPVCHAEIETIEHTLMECNFARAVWFGRPLGWRMTELGRSVTNLIQSRFLSPTESVAQKNYTLLFGSTVCWFLWKSRCKVLRTRHPTHTLSSQQNFFKQYYEEGLKRAEDSRRALPGQVQSRPRWIAPPMGDIKA